MSPRALVPWGSGFSQQIHAGGGDIAYRFVLARHLVVEDHESLRWAAGKARLARFAEPHHHRSGHLLPKARARYRLSKRRPRPLSAGGLSSASRAAWGRSREVGATARRAGALVAGRRTWAARRSTGRCGCAAAGGRVMRWGWLVRAGRTLRWVWVAERGAPRRVWTLRDGLAPVARPTSARRSPLARLRAVGAATPRGGAASRTAR